MGGLDQTTRYWDSASLAELNQTTGDWHPCFVTLSATKGLSERCFAEFILSEVEGLSMTALG